MRYALLSGAHVHTPGYTALTRQRDDLDLAVVWDDRPDRGQAIAAEMGCPFEPDLDRAISFRGVEAAVICAENAAHRPLVERVCAAGLDFFCEKPLALTLADCDAMLAAIEAAGVLAAFGFFIPYKGPVLTAQRFLADGGLGGVTSATLRMTHALAYRRIFDQPGYHWFVEPEHSGGGALVDLGSHSLHLALALLGPVAAVQAVATNASGIYPEVEDHAEILLTCRSGATAVVEASWVDTRGGRTQEVHGPDGVLTIALNGGCTVRDFRDHTLGEPRELELLPDQPQRLERLLALRSGELPRSAMAQELSLGRDAVALVAAANEAARTGRRVEL